MFYLCVKCEILHDRMCFHDWNISCRIFCESGNMLSRHFWEAWKLFDMGLESYGMLYVYLCCNGTCMYAISTGFPVSFIQSSAVNLNQVIVSMTKLETGIQQRNLAPAAKLETFKWEWFSVLNHQIKYSKVVSRVDAHPPSGDQHGTSWVQGVITGWVLLKCSPSLLHRSSCVSNTILVHYRECHTRKNWELHGSADTSMVGHAWRFVSLVYILTYLGPQPLNVALCILWIRKSGLRLWLCSLIFCRSLTDYALVGSSMFPFLLSEPRRPAPNLQQIPYSWDTSYLAHTSHLMVAQNTNTGSTPNNIVLFCVCRLRK